MAQQAKYPSTHDAAACADAADRSICYLQLYSRGLITPLRADPVFAARPDLLELIEGPNQENVAALPPNDLYTRTALAPDDRMGAAFLQSLDLDAEGKTPNEAIAPILAAVGDLPSRSFAMGQITTEAAQELRIQRYIEALLRYRANGMDDGRPPPSKAFMVRLLAEWEKDVSQDFVASRSFSLARSREALADALFSLGERARGEAVLTLAGKLPSDIAFLAALRTSDIAGAIQLVRANVAADPANARRETERRLLPLLIEARKWPDPRAAEDVGRLILELETQGALGPDAIIYLASGLPASLNADLSTVLEGILAGLGADRSPLGIMRHNGVELALARMELASGKPARFDAMIAAAHAKIKTCNADDRDACDVRRLVDLLIERGRVMDAKAMLDTPGGRAYLALASFQPFRQEISLGEGVPQTMEWMIEVETSRRQYGMAHLGLVECVRDRVKPQRVIFRDVPPDYDAALACARRAIALARDPKGIEITEEANTRLAQYGGPQGRAAAANMAIEFSGQMLKARPDITEEMEHAALDLWREAPPFKLDLSALSAMKQLATARLKADGRF